MSFEKFKFPPTLPQYPEDFTDEIKEEIEDLIAEDIIDTLKDPEVTVIKNEAPVTVIGDSKPPHPIYGEARPPVSPEKWTVPTVGEPSKGPYTELK